MSVFTPNPKSSLMRLRVPRRRARCRSVTPTATEQRVQPANLTVASAPASRRSAYGAQICIHSCCCTVASELFKAGDARELFKAGDGEAAAAERRYTPAPPSVPLSVHALCCQLSASAVLLACCKVPAVAVSSTADHVSKCSCQQ